MCLTKCLQILYTYNVKKSNTQTRTNTLTNTHISRYLPQTVCLFSDEDGVLDNYKKLFGKKWGVGGGGDRKQTIFNCVNELYQ